MNRLFAAGCVCLAIPCGALLAATFTVVNTSESGPGSLRQAILDANATAGADRIEFNIPGAGVHTIRPLSPLPALTDDAGVTIDGYTQPGSRRNTIAVGDDAILTIELNGALTGEGARGLLIRSSSNRLQGLVINGFDDEGVAIAIETGSNNAVTGCFLGTDPTGSSARPNVVGIEVAEDELLRFPPPSKTTIGGTSPPDRNLVSGNVGAGVQIGAGASETVVIGNYVGTNVGGNAPIANPTGIGLSVSFGSTVGGTTAGASNLISGNSGSGVLIFSAEAVIEGNRIGTNPAGNSPVPNGTGVQVVIGLPAILVGGEAPGTGNVISGNLQSGVSMFHPGGARVIGNLIGTDASGTLPLGNSGHGVRMLSGSNPDPGGAQARGNRVAFNGGAGIVIGADLGDAAARCTVSANSIHDNGGLGIDLASDGVTGNDSGDGDSGPNGLQNHPVLSAAVSDGISTRVEGSLDSRPASVFVIELFASPSCDPSGNGEGQTFLGAGSATTDAFGKASFVITVPAGATGQVVTATATDSEGNTSEFSPCVSAAFGTLPTSVPTLGAAALAALTILLGVIGAVVLARSRLP